MKYTVDTIQEVVGDRPIRFISKEHAGISVKYKWQCDTCSNIWEARPNDIRRSKQSGCPKCAGKAYTKEEIIEAAGRRKILITGAFTKMTDKTEWICADGHIWSASPFSVVTRGTGCPKCKSNINEEKCRFIFQSLTCHEFPKNRKILSGQELDGYCSELNIAFEYQGVQHYKEMYFHRLGRDLKTQQERDKQKRNMCNKLGITLIEIPYTEKQKEYFIARELEKHTSIIGQVNWDQFSFHTNYLSEFKKVLLSRDIQCLSGAWLGDRTKLKLRCIKCSHSWEATPTHLKGKNPTGCPKCGIEKSARKRRKS